MRFDAEPLRRLGSVALLLLLSVAVAAGCGDDETLGEAGASLANPGHEEGFYVPLSSAVAEREPSVTIEVRRDNPVLGGQVRLTDPHFERLPGVGWPSRVSFCCDRLAILAAGAAFTRPSSDSLVFAFASVRADEALGDAERVTIPGSHLYQFRSPALLMSTARETAGLGLLRTGSPGVRVLDEVRLRLAHDVIVLPVYVHQLAPEGERGALAPEQLRAAFDPPGIVTEERRELRNDRSGTAIVTRRWPSLGLPPDRPWEAAEIQFRLLVEDEIESAGLSRTLVRAKRPRPTGNACIDADAVAALHETERTDRPGIHLYIGGTINSVRNGSPVQVPGETCGAAQACRTSVSAEDFIILDGSRLASEPRTVARQLGHYLGLAEADDSSACGRPLLADPADQAELRQNLMYERESGSRLAPAQVARARRLACSSFVAWGPTRGFVTPACPP